MKTAVKKVFPIALAIGSIIGISMVNSDENNPLKKYEVIQRVNGNTVVFDTILPEANTYSIENYLSDLGLNNSDHIEIIQLDQIIEEAETFVMSNDKTCIADFKSVIKTNEQNNDAQTTKEKVIIKYENEEIIEESNGEKNIQVNKIEIKSDENISPEKIKAELKKQGLDDAMIDKIIEQINNKEGVQTESDIEMKMVYSTDSTLNLNDFDNLEEHVVYEKNEPNKKVKIAMIGDENSIIAIVSKVDGTSMKQSKKANETETNNVKFFPNPAAQQFELTFKNTESAKTTISISDLNGKQVYSKDLGLINGTIREKIQTSNWKTGVYLIQITAGKNVTTKKLVIK